MPALDKWSAYIVPLTLITIGLVGIYENFSRKDEDDDHDHAIPANGQRFGFMTYFTGIVHGLQPDALYVVIPALALPTKMAAVAFITMFVVGTCLSMGLYTLIIGVMSSVRRAGTTSKALIKEQPWLQSHLSTIACGIAILCGVLMLLAGQVILQSIYVVSFGFWQSMKAHQVAGHADARHSHDVGKKIPALNVEIATTSRDEALHDILTLVWCHRAAHA
eukprot:366130-Chlamydomonas_euryale.AAC.16